MAATCDVLVIGAGIAGCSIAATLAKQGRRIVIVERSLNDPDRIVGELLQPGGVFALHKLGLAHCLEGIEATPVEGYHLYWKDEHATFWFCPLPSHTEPESRKPVGRSFHHGKFVSNLRRAVANDPNVTLLETTAVELLRHETTGAVLGAVCSHSGSVSTEVCSLATLGCGIAGSNTLCSTAHLSLFSPTVVRPISGLSSSPADQKPNPGSGVSK